MQNGCSENNTYQMKWVTLFLTLYLVSSKYSSTSLWRSVSIFPENFNTNVISSQKLSFQWTIDLSSLFSKFAGWGWGPDFEGQSIIFNVQVPFVAGSSGNSSFYGYYNDQLNKTTETS